MSTDGVAPPGQAVEVTPREEELLRQAYEKKIAAQRSAALDPLSSAIRDKIVFRLMGYNQDGSTVEWSVDAGRIQSVEKHLVINPRKLKEEFSLLRQHWEEIEDDDEALNTFLKQHTVFGKYGGHSHLNTKRKIFRVRREGWAIMAGLPLPDGDFHTLAYNYGLDTMPKSDEEFDFLSQRTLNRPDAIGDGSKIAFNWRSGVAASVDSSTLQQAGIEVPEDRDEVSLRRMGIASAIKYIMVSLNQKNQKDQIWFNIGTIFDTEGYHTKIRNVPSYEHNMRIFGEDHGYRMRDSDIAIVGSHGERQVVGTMHWRARSDKITAALTKLRSEQGVLLSRGWSIDQLEQVAITMHEQIGHEKTIIGPLGLPVHI